MPQAFLAMHFVIVDRTEVIVVIFSYFCCKACYTILENTGRVSQLLFMLELSMCASIFFPTK